MGDFPPETGAFTIVKTKPLHIRLAVNTDGSTREQHYLAEDFFQAF